MKKQLAIFFFLLTIWACVQQQDQTRSNSYAPRAVEAKGHVVPQDQMAAPKSVLVGKSRVVKIGKPKIVPVKTNMVIAGKPKTVVAGLPKTYTPGKDSVSIPKVAKAFSTLFLAGIPETVVANAADSKDKNSQSFLSFTKRQGLKSDAVTCLLQDRNGNIWFGTWGGGAIRYDGKNLTNFSQKEGLRSNEVQHIYEDRAGNIWIGTYGCLSKYDGKNLTNFTQKAGLEDNDVTSILEDKSGNIWFGTDLRGVSKYDGKKFTNYAEREGLGSSSVSSIQEDRFGYLWFGTSGGVSRFDGRTFTRYTETEGLPNNDVSIIYGDKAGNLWFGTHQNGVSKFDGKIFKYYSIKQGLVNNSVICIHEDKSGNLWFGTNGGVSKFDGEYFTNFTIEEGLADNTVNAILEDGFGNLWFGTEGGASKYMGNTFTHYASGEGLNSNWVNTILEDKSGNLWFGTNNRGISKFDGKSFSHFTKKEGFGNEIQSTLKDRNGDLWFGTFSSGVIKFDGKSVTHYRKTDGLNNDFVGSIIEDRKGNLWFGTWGGGLNRFDGKSITPYTTAQGLKSNLVTCMLEDRNGNLWVGHREGGITEFDSKTFTHYALNEGIGENTIKALIEDKSGNLWIGASRGVWKYDGKTFTHYSEAEGLSNEDVTSIFEDKTGNLWFGTAFGLNKLMPKSLLNLSDNTKITGDKAHVDGYHYEDHEEEALFKSYSYEDGFFGIECNRDAIFEDKNGTIWIGTRDRLTAYHPEGDKKDTAAPNMQLTGVALFNENIPWANLDKKKDSSIVLANGVRVGNLHFDSTSRWYNVPEHLSLAFNNNYLTFNYIGITTNSPKKVRYRYKLEGLDEFWSALTPRTEANYGNLSPGHYSFKVKAMNGDGYWSKEINYSFTVRPPWWKTWWAYGLYLCSIIGSIWYYMNWRERALKERQKVLEKSVLERTAEVVAEKKKVETEMERSEELLLNILPSEVADELKQKGSAQARQFDEVTVMFTDFKGFTRISEKLTPDELVAEIHTCFKAFDDIITRNNIEKIKTIGDSYMCAGGLPVPNKTNATDVVNAAMEIQQFMKEHLEKRIEEGKESFEIRIGIHTGPVVAGIVGIKKFAYDVWGDTVNIASRMESSGESGKTNISGTTYELVKEKFNCIHRGKIEAKNKGLIDMFFVERVS